jgi:hypothetical protein
METFVGDTIRLILDTGIDISGYTTLLMRFKRPDGTTGEWSASLHSTNHKWMEYTTYDYDLDQDGIWAIQAYVESAAAFLHGKWVDFTVYNPIIYPMPT